MIDLAAVAARMIDLENEIPQAEGQPDEVPMVEVLAVLAGIDPKTPGLPEAVMREVARARELANRHYGPRAGGRADSPEILGTVSFLQGVTFARAASDIGGDSLRAYLDDAITKWRGKVAEAQSELDVKADAATEEAHLIARCYVDAFQSVRISMLYELLP